jgi:hydroxymethylglutaryl-CoA lyase
MDVSIVEVGPRDGLQNEPTLFSVEEKLGFIKNLIGAGLGEIEVASFVSAKWVPQMADATELWKVLPPGGKFSALVPNVRGLERAIESGVDRIAVFTAASDAFTRHNVNMSLPDSLASIGEIVSLFRAQSEMGFVRAYVSTAFECPYSGKVPVAQVLPVVEEMIRIGADDICIGDTIGRAGPKEVRDLGVALIGVSDPSRYSFHFHDTNGTALANVWAALDLGFRRFDLSLGAVRLLNGRGPGLPEPGDRGNLGTDREGAICKSTGRLSSSCQ